MQKCNSPIANWEGESNKGNKVQDLRINYAQDKSNHFEKDGEVDLNGQII